MRTHAVKWLALVALAAACFVAYQGVQGVIHVMDSWLDDLPSIEKTDTFNYAQESLMFAADESTTLAEFQLEKREPLTSIDQVSPFVLKGTVDTEDVRFYDHNGVDIPGIARAALVNIGGGSLEGASTITQQLVRNTVLSEEATEISFKRKVREAQLALDMEKVNTKDEILLMYLNTINYGDGCYGIEAAAQNYFQVSTLDLTLAQAAALVGIPQSPTYNNPKDNPDNCLARRNIVLERMYAAGDITKEERDAAQLEELGLNLAPEAPAQGIYAYPYFTSYVRDQLLAEDNIYGVSYADLFEGGLSVTTTLDVALQDKAEAACAAQNARMAQQLESSLVAIDPETGHVRALVGGDDYYADQWNIATQGGRPTGSSYKAFTLAAAIEQGIDPATLIDCTNPLTMDDGVTPLNNFGNIDYGIRSIQSATAVSSNTGYYRLAEKITPAAMNEMAKRLGVTAEQPNRPNVTLGTENVTPLDMASAYATLASGGIKRNPIAITKIVDKDGSVLYDAATDESNEANRVLTEEVAGATTKVLRSVFETTEGTASGYGPLNGQPVAGKTGTGMQFRDHWLVGYAPTLSCAAWIGDRNYESTDPSLTANALWQDFMSRALEGSAIVAFPETKAPAYKNAFNAEQKQKYSDKVKDEENDPSSPDAAPNVMGKTLSEAQGMLGGFVVYYVEEYSSTVPTGIIITQEMQPDRLLLTVSKGPRPDNPETGPSTTE